MTKIYSVNTYKSMPWKNKQGITTELFMYPQSGSLSELNFSWRLSSATLPMKSSFSKFPGFQRYLCLIRGHYMMLNDRRFLKYAISEFSGDENIECSTDSDENLDIGLIYNPQMINPGFEIAFSDAKLSSHNLVICLGSGLSIHGQNLSFLESAFSESEIFISPTQENPALIVSSLVMP